MNLSSDLLSQFVKITKDDSKQDSESTVCGTTVEYNGAMYVRLDGSELLTPVNTTTNIQPDERVTVSIKNHVATVTGNMTSPAARTGDVEDVADQISEFEIVIADRISADEAHIDKLVAENITVKEKLTANEAAISDLRALNATINGKLTAYEADIKTLQTEKLDATAADIKYATIESLEAGSVTIHSLGVTYGEFIELTAENFEAVNATINNLDATYASIDFANITEAAIQKIYGDYGLIDELIISEGHVTGELTGVTINGDRIIANSLQADKLVIKGSDGLYYQLNFEGGNFDDVTAVPTDGIHGSIIVAESITANKIAVDDLVAFGATIGGFHITNNSIYSGVKESIDNLTSGLYMDSNGQLYLGNDTNFLKFYKVDDENYKLDISAASVLLSGGTKNVEDEFDDVAKFRNKFSKYIRFMEDENGDPSDTALVIGSGDSAITLEIDNESGIIFRKKGEPEPFGRWDGEDFYTGNIVVEVNKRAQLGNFAFTPRDDGSLSFVKVGG